MAIVTHTFCSRQRSAGNTTARGLPPEKWSSLRYGFRPAGGRRRAVRTPFPAYPAWGGTTLNRDAATLVEYRREGQRGTAHQAFVPGAVWCPDTARADLEAVTGPVAKLTIVGTVRRERPGMLEARGEPAPLEVPLVVHTLHHVIDVADAFVVGREPVERWNVHGGHELVLPAALARHVQMALRLNAPASFAREAA